MRIDTVRLRGIGGFADETEFQFSPSMTVVLGPNDSGKSAMVWGVARTLLLDEVPAAEASWIRPDGPAWCEILLSVEEERILLRRDFRQGTASWRDLGSGETEPQWQGDLDAPADIAMYWDALQSRVGISNLEGWLRSVLLAAPLSNPVAGPDADPRAGLQGGPQEEGQEVLRPLEHELRTLTGCTEAGEEPAAGSPIHDSLRSLENTRRMAAEWEERTRRLQGAMDRMEGLSEKLDEAKAAAETRREVLDQLVRFQELTTERAELDLRLEELRRERDTVKGHVEAVERAERKLEEDYGDFLNMGTELETALQEWTDATGRLHDIQRRLHLARQALAALPVTHSRRNGLIVGVVLGILGWLGCIGAGAAGLAVVAAPVLALVGFGAVWLKDRSVEAVRVTRREEIIALDVEREEVEAMLSASREEMGGLAHLGHPMAIRRAVIQYWKAREEVEKLRAERDRFSPLVETMERYEESLTRRREVDAEAREHVARARYLAGLESTPASLAGEVDMARSQFDASQSRADRIQKEFEEISQELALFEAETPTLGQLERDLGRQTREHQQLLRRAEALQIAVPALRAALGAHRRHRRERLAHESNRILTDLTGGTLREIRFENGSPPQVLDAAGNWRVREALSRGTREQLDIAVRLAATRQGHRERPLPLILDDSFLGWDEDRLTQAHEVLKHFAEEGGQILLLSHDSRYESWGAQVIHLRTRHKGRPGRESSRAA